MVSTCPTGGHTKLRWERALTRNGGRPSLFVNNGTAVISIDTDKTLETTYTSGPSAYFSESDLSRLTQVLPCIRKRAGISLDTGTHLFPGVCVVSVPLCCLEGVEKHGGCRATRLPRHRWRRVVVQEGLSSEGGFVSVAYSYLPLWRWHTGYLLVELYTLSALDTRLAGIIVCFVYGWVCSNIPDLRGLIAVQGRTWNDTCSRHPVGELVSFTFFLYWVFLGILHVSLKNCLYAQAPTLYPGECLYNPAIQDPVLISIQSTLPHKALSLSFIWKCSRLGSIVMVLKNSTRATIHGFQIYGIKPNDWVLLLQLDLGVNCY